MAGTEVREVAQHQVHGDKAYYLVGKVRGFVMAICEGRVLPPTERRYAGFCLQGSANGAGFMQLRNKLQHFCLQSLCAFRDLRAVEPGALRPSTLLHPTRACLEA